jgi:YfiR/HmsC-like
MALLARFEARCAPPDASGRLVSGLCAFAIACVLLLGLAAWPAGALAQAPEKLEQRIKAVFLYKFAGYVDWPEGSFPATDTPITIGVMGSEPVAQELAQAIAGRTVNERPLVVRSVKPGDSLAGLHVLFMGKSENGRLAALLPQARSLGILSVTETEGALAQGSVINFVMAERKLRFEISLESAERNRLKLSARLLVVAQQVQSGTAQ